jgi:hypothetical protein
MIPKATMSSVTITRMNTNAALPGPEEEEDDVGVVVASAIGCAVCQTSRMTGRIRGRLEVCLLM